MAQEGLLFFSYSQDGRAQHLQRKPYGNVFLLHANLEYYRALSIAGVAKVVPEECQEDYANRATFRAGAIRLFKEFRSMVADPTLCGRPKVESAGPGGTRLGEVMCTAAVALHFEQTLTAVEGSLDAAQAAENKAAFQDALKLARLHYDKERRVFVENVPASGVIDYSTPDGRFFNPGHSVEVAWFLLRVVEVVPDSEAEGIALKALLGSLEAGWDTEHGGIFYMQDILGKPLLDATVVSEGKLWWPHTEAIYACMLAFARTKDQAYLDWLVKVHDYSYKTFVDKEHGEWFGYCNRDGSLARSCKGGNYKGCFHVPRGLLFSIQAARQVQ